MVTSDVEYELMRIRLMCRMTVNTHARHLSILYDSVFIESREVALINAHVTEHFITRGYATISQPPFIQCVWTNRDAEVLILYPCSVFPDTNGHSQLSALVLLCQLVPVGYIKISLIALHMQFAAL